MYIQNHVAIEPTNDDAIENDKENNENIRLENMNENSFAFKQENTEDNEPATKGYYHCLLWQYRLWSFQGRDTKFERFLTKNQL